MDGDEEGIQGASSRLRAFVISDLQKLEALPHCPIQGPAARTLKYLYIKRCHNLKALARSFENLDSRLPSNFSFARREDRLTALQVLKIDYCPELTKRCRPKTGVLALHCPFAIHSS